MKLQLVFPYNKEAYIVQLTSGLVSLLDVKDVLPESISSSQPFIDVWSYDFSSDEIIMIRNTFVIPINLIMQKAKPCNETIVRIFNLNIGNGSCKTSDEWWVRASLEYHPFREKDSFAIGEFYGNGSSECGGFINCSANEILSNAYFRKLIVSCNCEWLIELIQVKNEQDLNDIIIKKIYNRLQGNV